MGAQPRPRPVRLSRTRLAAIHRQHAFSVGSPLLPGQSIAHPGLLTRSLAIPHCLKFSQRGREMTVRWSDSPRIHR